MTRVLAILFLLLNARASAQTTLDWARIWIEASRQQEVKRVSEQTAEQTDAVKRNAADLAERYKGLAATLENLAVAMDSFSTLYNRSQGQAVLLREQRLLNEAVVNLVEAWKQLKRCESWAVK